MRYARQVWGQSKNWVLTKIGKNQNKALRLSNFNPFTTLTVVNNRQSVYSSLHKGNMRESAQNESSHKVTYIRGYKSCESGSHSFATFS